MPRIRTLDAIPEILSAYAKEVGNDLEDVIKDVAKDAQKSLRKTSPRRPKGGAYARSWRTQNTGTRIVPGQTVYSTKPGLPHLLEFGHAKRGGGRTTPQPHIAPVNDKIPDEIIERLERKLK